MFAVFILFDRSRSSLRKTELRHHCDDLAVKNVLSSLQRLARVQLILILKSSL